MEKCVHGLAAGLCSQNSDAHVTLHAATGCTVARLHMSMANTPTWQTPTIAPHPCVQRKKQRGAIMMWPLQSLVRHFEQSIATVHTAEGRQGGRPCATGQGPASDDIEKYGKKSDGHMVGHALKRVHRLAGGVGRHAVVPWCLLFTVCMGLCSSITI
jgi:hypothetical protein